MGVVGLVAIAQSPERPGQTERGATMAQNNTTTTEPTKADKLAERAKRTAERATERQAKAEAERVKAEKLAAAAEAEAIKQAEREAAKAAKAAEAERHQQDTKAATEALVLLAATETAGLVTSVEKAWRLGEVIISAGLKARPVAIAAMPVADWEAKQAEAKAKGKQAQPDYLSKVNDSVNVRKRFATEAEAISAAGEWALANPKNVSLRAFATGENVNKPKRKGDPMSAKAAARLFAQAVARDGLTGEQAMDLIAEAMASAAE